MNIFRLNRKLVSQNNFMEKETTKIEEEIIEEVEKFYRQYSPKISYRNEPCPNQAFFDKQFEEAQALVEKIKFPPDWKTRK